MLDRKIFFLILAILGSYFLFVKDGFQILVGLVGLDSVDGYEKDRERREKESEKKENFQSGGDPLNENQGAGILQARYKSNLKNMIQQEVSTGQGAKL